MTPAEPRGADRVDLAQIQADLEFPPKPIAHGLSGYWRQVILDLAAEVARLERVVDAARDWYAIYRGGSVPSKTLSDVVLGLADAVAALGTQGPGDGD